MNPVSEAIASLTGAMTQLSALRGFDVGAVVKPPGFVIGPPSIKWDTMCSPSVPTSATFIVYVIVARDGVEVRRLVDLILPVVELIESETHGAVAEAFPAVYPVGELPCYQLTVEYPL